MPQVYLSTCPTYDQETVDSAVARGLAAIDPGHSLLRAGQRVVLKPNLLQAQRPEKGITTHPAVVSAVARWVKAAGAHPIIVDSPGGRSSWSSLRTLYEVTGMAAVAEQTGSELGYDASAVNLSCPDGYVIKMLETLKVVAEADAIINLPKLKTHGITQLTIATKNLFGTIPGIIKAGYHIKLPTPGLFSDMLIDVLCRHQPVLTVTDAIVGMDGNGPAHGRLRSIGLLLLSTDAVAADVVAADIVGIQPLSIPPIAAAAQRGLTTARCADIEVLGARPEEVRINAFSSPDTGVRDLSWIPASLRSWASGQLVASPVPTSACVGCGICAENCPPNALRIVGGRATIDLRRCIRCYCCHELCPYGAMDLRLPTLGKMMNRRLG